MATDFKSFLAGLLDPGRVCRWMFLVSDVTVAPCDGPLTTAASWNWTGSYRTDTAQAGKYPAEQVSVSVLQLMCFNTVIPKCFVLILINCVENLVF